MATRSQFVTLTAPSGSNPAPLSRTLPMAQGWPERHTSKTKGYSKDISVSGGSLEGFYKEKGSWKFISNNFLF